jgi:glycosyltransferase involved in cell wall biosynthesis
MKKVLVITSTYPITGGSRIERFVKYLGDFGYQPVVLTTRRNRHDSEGEKLNTSVGNIRVYRAFSIRRTPFRILSRYFKLEEAKDFLERLFFIPDLGITWVPDAIIEGLKIIKNENIELILSTSPPESAHIIGMMLSKFTGKKWIADFRDLWTPKEVSYRPPTILHHKIATKLEEYFFSKADRVIAVTEEIRKMYLNSFQIGNGKITVITNGYDPDDLKSITAQTHLDRDYLSIGYMGTFEKRGFPWKQFLIALCQLINFKPGAKVQVNIYGEVPSDNVMYFITEKRLTNYIKFHGEFSHSDAMRLTAENDLLLLLLYETDYSVGTATLKLYNYLIMEKPIFAISPESGAAARIIRETNTGKIVSPKNNEGILKTLVEYYEMWSAEGKLEIFPNWEEIKKYEGRILTENLAKVFDRVSKVGMGMKI